MIVTRLYIYNNSVSEICLNIGSDKPLQDNDFYLIGHLFNKFDLNSSFYDDGNTVEYIYWPGGKTKYAIGKIEGKISNVKKGTNGFGYDPIFIPKNKKITFGEMRPLKKYNIDHRKKAYKKIRKFF